MLLISVIFAAYLSAQKLTVFSYNIRYENDGDASRGNGWKLRCPVISQLIQFNDVDLIGAQEVLDGQLKDLLMAMPEYDYIGVGRDDGRTRGEYAPIFYKKDKFEKLYAGHFWLAEITDRPVKGWDAALPRICTYGEFKDKKSGLRFWMFNLHMDHIGVEARKESARLVLNKIKEIAAQKNVILTGDFNVDQHDESYVLINTSGILTDAYETAEIRYALNGTFNAFNPAGKTESRIDHIFISGRLKVERYGVLTDTYRAKSADFPDEPMCNQEYLVRVPSDHFPVKVELSYMRK